MNFKHFTLWIKVSTSLHNYSRKCPLAFGTWESLDCWTFCIVVNESGPVSTDIKVGCSATCHNSSWVVPIIEGPDEGDWTPLTNVVLISLHMKNKKLTRGISFEQKLVVFIFCTICNVYVISTYPFWQWRETLPEWEAKMDCRGRTS